MNVMYTSYAVLFKIEHKGEKNSGGNNPVTLVSGHRVIACLVPVTITVYAGSTD